MRRLTLLPGDSRATTVLAHLGALSWKSAGPLARLGSQPPLHYQTHLIGGQTHFTNEKIEAKRS